MAAIKSPFQQFFDTDGGPLDTGFIYIGTAGQNPETNPITVYWDSALTQPAVQPIRTLNGYIVRSGTPAQLYTAAGVVDYSMTARNRRSEIVFSELSVSPLAGLQADLAAAIHAAPLDADPSELDELGIWDSVTGLLRKITFTFLQSGAGAILITIRRALRLSIWAEHYGADPAATAAVNGAAFAAAIAEAFARGGGVVNVGSGLFNISAPITLKSNVILLGQGSNGTEIFLAAGSNCDMLTTDNFAGLTGMNLWFVSEGVPVGFGFDRIKFNGNRLNQLAGNGVRIYGKSYHVGFDVKVVGAKEIGFYSECAYKGGQTVDEDMPEGHIGKVQVYMSGKEGFVFRGPHDQPIHDVSVSQAGQDGTYDGVRIESKLNVFNGLAYVTGSIHSYACTGRGVTINTSIKANQITGESNVKEGVVLEAAGETVGHIGAFNCDINICEAYQNDSAGSGLYYAVRDSGGSNNIANLRVTVQNISAGGLRVVGNLSKIRGFISASGAVAHGIGALVEGNYATADLTITNFNTAGDIGLKTDAMLYGDISATIFSANTSWVNAGASVASKYRISAFSAAGTAFTQTGSFSATDTFEIALNHGGAAKLSHYNGTDTSILVGNTSVTLTHNGFVTPKASDIRVMQTMNWANAGVARSMWITNITATQFDVVTDVAAPVGGLTFSWELDI